MKLRIFISLASLLIPNTLSRPLNKYNQIVAFGDSFTDGGKGAWTISNHTWPLVSYYSGHRFSNGKVWVQELSSLLRIPLLDKAIGGATTNNTLLQGFTGPNSSIPVPSTLDQVALYLESSSFKKHDVAKTLFVVGGGGNDAFFGFGDNTVTPSSTVGALCAAVNALKGQGAKNFLIPNLPAFGMHYPFTTLVPSYASYLATFSAGVKTELENLVKIDSSIKLVDTYDLFLNLMNNSQKFGFDSTKFNQSCLVGVYAEVPGDITICDSPSTYFWWDEYHPTTRVHAYLGQEAYSTLCS